MSGSPRTPQQFVTKWRGVQLSERASVQEHFLDLCALFGQPTPASADPTGAWYTFEKGVTKTGGGQGFAVEKSIAYAYLPPDAGIGARGEVEVFGRWVGFEVMREPLYDPANARVKG